MMKTRKGYKVYPLTVAQKFHLYYLPHCPSAAVLNIGTSLTIEVEIDWEVLEQSINKAYERCEGMRVRLAKDKEGSYYQYVVKHEDRDIEFVDFTGKTMEEAEETMREWTRVPFKMEDTRLTRIVMIKMPDGFSGVYFLGHHMIVDAQSLIGFLKDIIELYCNAKYEGVPYPKDMCSYIEQIQKDLAYEAGSRAQQRDREFFEEKIASSEPIFNGLRGGRPGNVQGSGPTHRVQRVRQYRVRAGYLSSGRRTDSAPDGVLRKIPCIPGMPSAHGSQDLFPEDERS